MKKFLIIILATLLLMTGCDNSPEGKTYLVATDATLVPMSFMSVGNDIIGFEPDLIRAVAKEAGINIQLVNVEWAGLFGGLITKKFDMAISSVTVLEERKERMAFSDPYLKSGLALVIRKDQEGIDSFADAKKNNSLIGAQIGTTAYFFLEKDPAIRLKGYQMYGHAVSDLINGKIDAVLGESTGTLFYKNQQKPLFEKIKMVGEIMSNEHYAIVFRQEDIELRTQVNIALQKVLKNGTVSQLHKKWDLGQSAQVPELMHPPTQ
ncbi:MAG: transporter substrate-binding domain-containing protein [Nitrospinae bacterium]|nr:transporter substrate-binding domain-containing protein [Nitrospinota bacterium]MBL7021466.1 transporter substrate-binding domain-containing protein [Nitrospinaceae bacterium]